MKSLEFIADIGANHDGSLSKAIELIHMAAEAGATTVKFQHFDANSIVSDAGFRALGNRFGHQASWSRSVHEVYDAASIEASWNQRLFDEAKAADVEFMTSPYSLDRLAEILPYVKRIKIGSGEISSPQMLGAIARTEKEILLATGASSSEDVFRALSFFKLDEKFTLMQCNTNYTGDSENIAFTNLRVLNFYRSIAPKVKLGLSDHTPTMSTVLGAVALGATVFEKHFTDNRSGEGPDHSFAIEPAEWREMVDRAEEVYLSLGDGQKKIEANEIDTAIVQRRGLYAKKSMDAGVEIRLEMFDALRPIPKRGVSPMDFYFRASRLRLAQPLEAGECLLLDHVIESF